MQPDLEKYRAHLDDCDLTEDQKTELIHNLWGIMESFVDHAFGLYPSQQVPGADIRKIVLDQADLIESGEQPDEAQQE